MTKEHLTIALDFDREEDPAMEAFLIGCGHRPLFPGERGGEIDLAICRHKARALAMKEAGIPVIGIETGRDQLAADLVLTDFDALEEEDLLRTYRRGRGIPEQVIRTERLIIREMLPSDSRILARLHESPGATEYMEPLGGIEGTEALIRTYRDCLYPLFGMGAFMIVRREKESGAAGPVIGRIDLIPSSICQGGQAEVGYLIDAGCRRRGYAGEALRAICSYARDELALEELLARVHPDNIPSRKLLEEAGFIPEDRGSSGRENPADYWHLSL